MGFPHPEQFSRHNDFISEHGPDLVAMALAGYQVYGRGAVIIYEAEQTMRYQGGGARAFAGKRWRKEAAWVRMYDPEVMMVIIFNCPEGTHVSYLMKMPWSGQEVSEQMAAMELADEGRSLMDQILKNAE
jgi:hypothetical protein